jgi:predicted NBD/HSP70 family sugar kinase
MKGSTVIGIDVGGTKSAMALYDAESLSVLAEDRFPTLAKRGFEHVLEDVLARVETLKRDDTVALGMTVPGLVRSKDGSIVSLPNIPGGEGVDLRDVLRERTSFKIAVGNDSQGFALAEARDGAGKGHRIVVGVTMGTGVGGGIIVDGEIFGGEQGFAGEIGHMLLRPGQPPFSTENARGEVEQFLSGTALGKRCSQAKNPQDFLTGETCAFLHPDLFQETAWMCVNLVHLLNPSVIIFGGSTGRALQPHLPAIVEKLKQWVLPETPLPLLSVAMLKDAATRGAAMLALR